MASPDEDARGLEELVGALHELDGELSAREAGPMEVRALGGFALAYRGLRPEGLTVDIDTATPTYPADVRRAIEAVAERRGLAGDWVNNQTVFSFGDVVGPDDVAALDDMLDARYLPVEDERFDNIDLQVADVPTLVKSKAYAVCDIELGWRDEKDLADLVSALAAVGVDDVGAACSRFPWLMDPEFSYCLERLEDRLASQGPHENEAGDPGRGVDLDAPDPRDSRPSATSRLDRAVDTVR